MSRFLSIAIAASVSILTFSIQTVSQQPAGDKKVSRMQVIIEGPVLELATDNSAIIRWKTNTGSSLIEHSVVHYGTDAKDLNTKAESQNRWNRNLPYMIHRVNLMKLKPGTKYYYKVESVRGDGTPLGGKSNAVRQFTTKSTPRQRTPSETGSR